MPKARATWQWWNFLEGVLPRGKQLLRLNMDETACRLHYKARKGDLADRSVAAAQKEGRLVEDVGAGQQKAALSHMAVVCDVPSLQPEMPQVILGNEHILRQALVSSLSPTLPANVHVHRRKSSWVNHEVMAEWGRTLSNALAPHRKKYQPVLLLDACGVHNGKEFLQALQRGGVWVIFVPAGLTWLLAPCDTHVFAKYKRFLRDRQHERVLKAAGPSVVSAAHALDDIVLGIRRILQGTEWASAFNGNGYGEQQRCVRRRILDELGCVHVSDVPATLPELSALESIFPRGRTPEISLLFGGVRASLRNEHPLAEPVAANPPLTPEEEEAPFVSPWVGRLRSSSTLHLADPLAQEAEPPLPPPSAPPLPCPKAPPAASPAERAPARLPIGRPLPRPQDLPRPARRTEAQ